MKTKEEMLSMSHEELTNYAEEQQSKAVLYDFINKKCERLKELLAAVGIAYETYRRENP